MASPAEQQVEVAYATAERQVVRVVAFVEGGTVRDAIESSGILTEFPEIDLNVNRVGIYGELTTLSASLQGGERIEIYRPLVADPKEARRRRARARSRRR